MAIATESSFDSWLNTKLKSLNTDEGVYGSYIKGILEGDESEDEKTQALEMILESIAEGNISNHVSEILSAWAKSLPASNVEATVNVENGHEFVLEQLRNLGYNKNFKSLYESQKDDLMKRGSITDEDKRIREAVLAQYSQMSDGDEEEEAVEVNPEGTSKSGLEKNMNVANIIQQEKEKREKAKQDSQKKKLRDKEDREKQKQVKEDKKEKRKTQKNERKC